MSLHNIASRVAIMFGSNKAVVPCIIPAVNTGNGEECDFDDNDLVNNYPEIVDVLQCVIQVNQQLGSFYSTYHEIKYYHREGENYDADVDPPLKITLKVVYIDPDFDPGPSRLPIVAYFNDLDPSGILDSKFKQLESKAATCAALTTDCDIVRIGYGQDPGFISQYILELNWDPKRKEYVSASERDPTGTGTIVPADEVYLVPDV